MTNNVYKSLQDNNEDQCIVMLGESSSGKTENARMVLRFLSKISGKFIPLQRLRSSNSIASLKSSPKSSSSTPKHKSSSTSTIQSVFSSTTQGEKSSCFKSESGGKNKKISRVEFDFSYKKCNHNNNDIDAKHHDMIKYCPKHNCCNVSSSSSTASTNPIDIPVRRKNTNYHHNHQQHSSELSPLSKSFTIYETMNRVHNNNNNSSNKKVPNCLEHQAEPKQARCESLDLIKVNFLDNITNKSKATAVEATPTKTNYISSFDDDEDSTSIQSATKHEKKNPTQFRDPSYDRYKINLDNFKSAKRKVPIKNPKNVQLSNVEIQTMKERIAQAEIFLEAMGNASTTKNRDSSRYVSFLVI